MGVHIGNFLKKIRKERDLPQKYVAARSGLDQSCISIIERGKKNLSLNSLSRILGVYQLTQKEKEELVGIIIMSTDSK